MTKMKLQNLVKNCVSSQDDYQTHASEIVEIIRKADLNQCKDVISAIKKEIKDKHVDPPSKLRALELLDACMMVNNYQFLTFAQKKILDRLTILARHKKQIPSNDRGEDIFGAVGNSSDENKEASKRFLVFLLDRIKAWNMAYGRTSDGKISRYGNSYQTLVKENVTFPDPPIRSQSVNIKDQPSPKSEAGRRSSIQTPRSSRPKNSSAVDLKAEIENLLNVFSEMISFPDTQREMIDELARNLTLKQKELESSIQISMNSDNKQEIVLLLEINDRITSALSVYKDTKKKANLESNQDVRPLPGATLSIYGNQHSNSEKEFQELKNKVNFFKNLYQVKDQEYTSLKKINEDLRNQLEQRDEMIRQLSKNGVSSLIIPREEAYSQALPDIISGPNEDLSENLELFIKCNRTNRGIIYEDEDLQIGIQVSKQEDNVLGYIYFGNKSAHPITVLNTEISHHSQDSISITLNQTYSSDVTTQGSQANRNIRAKLLIPTGKIPKMIINLTQGHQKQISLSLPITMARFLNSLQVSHQEIWNIWQRLAMYQRESHLKTRKIKSVKKIAKDLSFNGAFNLCTAEEISELRYNQILGAGEKGTIVLVLLEINTQNNEIRAYIRSESVDLRNAVSDLISKQLSD